MGAASGSGLVLEVTALPGSALILRISGDIDLATVEETAAILDDATAQLPPPDLVIVDLCAASFLSVAGVRALERFASTAAERGVRTRLVAQGGTVVHRVMHITRLDRRVEVFETIDCALAARGRRN
ncbi:STAS domain-containing protein [Skermania sp. ID1734]|uniref:STAS domain-containing protein n=1 Tax=Skermania sp. ID1734 TaxID=2597516 RepID=UPI00163D7E85|nr:STAS domain-containing protein [Skermania sp. ID1734]